jgi:hypothetical protein
MPWTRLVDFPKSPNLRQQDCSLVELTRVATPHLRRTPQSNSADWPPKAFRRESAVHPSRSCEGAVNGTFTPRYLPHAWACPPKLKPDLPQSTMFLPPLPHLPSDAELAAIEPEHAIAVIAVIAVIAAVFCGDAGAGKPEAPVGMTTHLWVARAGMDGVALCGARLLSRFKQWRLVPGQRVDCIRCLSLHAEVLSNHP